MIIDNSYYDKIICIGIVSIDVGTSDFYVFHLKIRIKNLILYFNIFYEIRFFN